MCVCVLECVCNFLILFYTFVNFAATFKSLFLFFFFFFFRTRPVIKVKAKLVLSPAVLNLDTMDCLLLDKAERTWSVPIAFQNQHIKTIKNCVCVLKMISFEIYRVLPEN